MGLPRLTFVVVVLVNAHPGPLTAPRRSVTLALLIMARPGTFGGAHLIQTRTVLGYLQPLYIHLSAKKTQR